MWRGLLIGAAVLALAGCQTARDSKSVQGAREGIEAKGGFGGALAAPLHDVNILRTKIPPVLLDAMEAPYGLPKPVTCAEIAAELNPLNEALGADLDTPPTEDNPGVLERGGSAAGGAAVDALRGAAEGIIPMRGWVRRLTGAEQHDKLVRAAVNAGAIRRSFLKGLGASRRCNPPAAPTGAAMAAYPTGFHPEEGRKKPQYPTH